MYNTVTVSIAVCMYVCIYTYIRYVAASHSTIVSFTGYFFNIKNLNLKVN